MILFFDSENDCKRGDKTLSAMSSGETPGQRRCVLGGLRRSEAFSIALTVDDLSFKVDPGRPVGFLGPNGAGKTTTLRALLGLIRPTAGTATVEGRTFGALEDPAHTVGAVLDA